MRGNTPAAGIRQMGRLLSTRTVWDDFTVHVQKDAKLWAFLVALLAAVRAVLMTTHSGQLDRTTGAAALLAAFASGLRYDCQVATWVIVPVLLASVVGSATASTGLPDRVRLGLGTAVVALSVVIGGIDLGYVGEAPPIFAQAAGARFYYIGHDPAAPRAEALVVPKDSRVRSVAEECVCSVRSPIRTSRDA